MPRAVGTPFPLKAQFVGGNRAVNTVMSSKFKIILFVMAGVTVSLFQNEYNYTKHSIIPCVSSYIAK